MLCAAGGQRLQPTLWQRLTWGQRCRPTLCLETRNLEPSIKRTQPVWMKGVFVFLQLYLLINRNTIQVPCCMMGLEQSDSCRASHCHLDRDSKFYSHAVGKYSSSKLWSTFRAPPHTRTCLYLIHGKQVNISESSTLKDKSGGYILYFSVCQQIPWKDQRWMYSTNKYSLCG